VFGWKWDSVSYGKAGPGELLAAFPVSEVPAPARRRQRCPEGKRKAVSKQSGSALGIQMAGIVAASGASERPRLTFSARSPLGPHCFSADLERPAGGSCVSLLWGKGGRGPGRMGRGVSGVPSASSHVSLPARPHSLSFSLLSGAG
jgi:hypothetical protein